MLKDFMITVIDRNGNTTKAVVSAFSLEQARHAYIYGHPDVDMTRLTCEDI